MKTANILLLTISSFLFVTCGEYAPQVDFDKTIKGRQVNLSNRLGESFQILRANDTITYRLSFDKTTQTNYLIKADIDTIFEGTVTKRNELYLLNNSLSNGNYSIHALAFTDSTITGLETEWLQSYILKNELDSGSYASLVIDTIGGYTVSAEKKQGKEIFRWIIDKLEAEKIITPEVDLYQTKDAAVVFVEDDNTRPVTEDTGLIVKVYPNPFVDQITVELKEMATYIFDIYDTNGVLMVTKKQQTDRAQLFLNDLKSGQYILRVHDDLMIKSDQIRIIKD